MEGRLGAKVLEDRTGATIKTMYPGSPSELSGLMLEDKVIAINGYSIEGN